MNEFEKRINALRLQFKAEREMIQKDCNRTIGHLNTAIGMVNTLEAREALRAEKARIYEAARNSMKYNRLCYNQQLEALQDEYHRHLGTFGSKRQLRRIMEGLCRAAAAEGKNAVSISFGDNQNATICFD